MPARLLIVDDEPAICFALSRFFSERGDIVSVAPSAEEALRKLPEAERKEWEKLWADVDAQLNRAQGQAPATAK